jgi:hypothetical protein
LKILKFKVITVEFADIEKFTESIVARYKAGIAQRFFDIYTAYEYSAKDLHGYFVIEDFGSKRYSLFAKSLAFVAFDAHYKNELFLAFLDLRTLADYYFVPDTGFENTGFWGADYNLLFRHKIDEANDFLEWQDHFLYFQIDFDLIFYPHNFCLELKPYFQVLIMEEQRQNFYNSLLWDILKFNRKNKSNLEVRTKIYNELKNIEGENSSFRPWFWFRKIKTYFFSIPVVYRYVYFLMYLNFKEVEYNIFDTWREYTEEFNFYSRFDSYYDELKSYKLYSIFLLIYNFLRKFFALIFKSKYSKIFFGFILSLSNIEGPTGLYPGRNHISISPKYSNSSLALLFSTFLLD